LAEHPKQRERLVEKFGLDLNPPDQVFWQLDFQKGRQPSGCIQWCWEPTLIYPYRSGKY